MMEKILLNTLLLLGVVWMLLGIVFFCFQFFPLRNKARGQKQEGTISPPPEKEPKKGQDSHVLIGKSKTFIAPSIPQIPAVSSSEKAIENTNTFAGQNAQTEQQAAEETEDNKEEGENEIQVAYTMDEPDEDAIVREELQIADEAMPEAVPTGILSRDLEKVSRWSNKDDTLDDEYETEVHETLRSIRGTDLMEYMKKVTLQQEPKHRKLLAAIRKVEEAEQPKDPIPASSDERREGNNEDMEGKPLSYYL